MDVVSDSFFFQVIRIRKAIIRKSTALMLQAGVTLPIEQLPILVILQKKGTLSQRELSDIMLRDKSSILRSVNALQKKGLIKIEQDSTDKRKNNIDLSAEGKKMATQIGKLMQKAEVEALSVFKEKERIIAFNTIKSYADKLEGI
jgi:DNA-binding MarR family transcriptional regulator